MIHHDDVEVTAGDDWTIVATIVDRDGVTPLDLTSATVFWTLINRDGACALPAGSAVLDLGQGAQGVVLINLQAAATAPLGPGRYVDQIRVVLANQHDMVTNGYVLVDADYLSIPH